MQTFEYVIQAAEGLHARPAGLLVKCAQGCASDVTIVCGGKRASAKKLFAVMGLGVKQGDRVTFETSGDTEAEDLNTIREFCGNHI
jgi:phosphotransferase system HPr (HPr) family protein